jgi:hypothetical protein
MDPVIGTLLGALVLKEPVTSYFLGGSILIFGGILLAEGRLHYHRFAESMFVQSVQKTITNVEDKVENGQKKLERNKHEILASLFGKK